jgi:hypothetical protein
VSYNAFKTFEGMRCTGMKIGRRISARPRADGRGRAARVH